MTRSFDYEVTKKLEFTVYGVAPISQNPEQTVTMQARVVIYVLDVDDNCPTFVTPTVITTRYSSPVPAETIVGRVQMTDADSKHNHLLSVTDTTNFKVDSEGNIRALRRLESLVELAYDFNVTATNTNNCKVRILKKMIFICHL